MQMFAKKTRNSRRACKPAPYIKVYNPFARFMTAAGAFLLPQDCGQNSLDRLHSTPYNKNLFRIADIWYNLLDWEREQNGGF